MADSTYATLQQLKDRLNVQDSLLNPMLQSMLNSAAQAVDKYTGRGVPGTEVFSASTSTTKYYDYASLVYNPSVDPIARLYIRDAVTITAVVVGGTTTLTANTDYFQCPYTEDRGNGPIEWLEFATALAAYPLALQFPWGNVGKRQIAITGTWGYCTSANRPPEIAEATLVQAVRMYERQNLPVSDVLQAMTNPFRELDPYVKELIGPYRKVVYVA